MMNEPKISVLFLTGSKMFLNVPKLAKVLKVFQSCERHSVTNFIAYPVAPCCANGPELSGPSSKHLILAIKLL